MKKRFMMYAQDFEDWILFCALQGVDNGFYVDVGANDPWFLSVTKAFYERGWSGINIEPLEDKYQELCGDRQRDINLNIGAGGENGELEFLIAGMATTCDIHTAQKMEEQGATKKKIIPVRRLSDILAEHIKDENQIIHFCKIDVEGFEHSVLEGMDFSRFRPWIIVMEATLPGTGIPCHDKWEELLLDNEYEFSYARGVNRYYIDNKLDDAIKGNIKRGFSNVDMLLLEYHVMQIGYDRDVVKIIIYFYRWKYWGYKIVSLICPVKSFRDKLILKTQKYNGKINKAKSWLLDGS
jgi:FkbM family methyltransferase